MRINTLLKIPRDPQCRRNESEVLCGTRMALEDLTAAPPSGPSGCLSASLPTTIPALWLQYRPGCSGPNTVLTLPHLAPAIPSSWHCFPSLAIRQTPRQSSPHLRCHHQYPSPRLTAWPPCASADSQPTVSSLFCDCLLRLPS